MGRTITVRGTGKLKLKPDVTVINLTIKSLDKDYSKAMRAEAERLDALTIALVAAGLSEESIKTQNFFVNTEYEGVRDENGNYRNVFSGYSCSHQLTVRFPFDNEKLGKALSAVAASVSEPELNIQFTVKDKDAIALTLLGKAAEDARARAEAILAPTGARLGKLISADYNWGQGNFVSPTNYANSNLRMMKAAGAMEDEALDIRPDDVTASDNVTFVWEIE
ncbi:MAG: SIMPL domain-containing protein [Clostridia bacterium]|nr:SIMPL domain-containing protein [Clostridia bacterium]